jgi:NAD(P)-dependent dehydrogenase (short-subunit alcohol dehydrogenase family)
MDVFGQFSLEGKVAVITGGTGVLGGALAHGLAAAGAKVGILGRREEKAAEVARTIDANGGSAIPLPADVLELEQLKAACATVVNKWGRVDILVNAAGGNMPGATVFGNLTFFDLPQEAFAQVMALNLTGTLLSCQVFGRVMAEQKSGSVINISSMAVTRAITRVVGYSAAKAGIDNFTRWLAVDFALKYGEQLRVNAIAPGFFIGDQNRNLLLQADGTPTERGKMIINATPFKRFGEPQELIGTAVWLASEASRFVTGVVIPVDGGFSAFSGV